MSETRERLLALLTRYDGDPHRLHDEVVALDLDLRDIETTVLGGRFEPMTPLLGAARWLISHGADDRLRLLGLKLLDGAAEPADVQEITSLARVPALRRFAVQVLVRVPGAERTAVRLAEDAGERYLVIRRLITHTDPWIADWVRAHCGDGSVARRVAEAHDLLGLLDQFDVPDRLWDQAGRLLHGMSRAHGYSVLHEYADAVAACRRWVELAHLRPATPERLVALIAFADEIATGYAALVLGDQRVDLVAALREIASAWIEELGSVTPWATLRVAALDVPPSGFAVRVVTSPPDPVSAAEARVVIDGVPIAARVFGCWRADSPEQVIPRLTATTEPREIVLDENDGAELRVTIVREGDEVVWRDWKCVIGARLPGEHRFDAAAYDREVARVAQDHSWEWPARTVARLVTERLQADPSILGRRGFGRGSCWSSWDGPDLAELDFAYAEMFTEPHFRFRMRLDVAGRDPGEVADETIAGLEIAVQVLALRLCLQFRSRDYQAFPK
ncbi:hypothetical protein [Lentzea sp. NBRC 102530]|uniref:hypothetical protein n=1 Tax=Lentzea sp. NBRC 102530 TaxID=3032201 RepID=UPI0024A2B341|nr:hypothetical protein [Lentzea sp. NBRC 102530]GLY50501.1 hypothetical protein Lesp01_41570 [Lentzea sp. NBRC 102530]